MRLFLSTVLLAGVIAGHAVAATLSNEEMDAAAQSCAEHTHVTGKHYPLPRTYDPGWEYCSDIEQQVHARGWK